MPLSKSVLVLELKNMSEDADGVGDTIGKAITKYTNSLTPIVAGPLKVTADNVFIEALNKSNFLVPLPPVLGTALGVYTLALAGIMVAQGAGSVATALPPPAPATPLITPIFATPQTKDIFAQTFATTIDTWFRTGTWVTPTGIGFTWI